MITQEEAIKLWKELGVESCTMDFYCGGDSMGDTSFVLLGSEGTIDCDELLDFFEDEVYKHVDFYVNSDGHYQGESGNVEIVLEDYDGEEEFSYSKSATSEWSETIDNTLEVELTDEMVSFIVNNVLNIRGGYDDKPIVNFKQDFIMSDEEEKILNDISNLIDKTCEDFVPETDDELEEWYNYTTNERGEEIIIKDNKLQIQISNSVIVFTESD
jgi:hypothetical protein